MTRKTSVRDGDTSSGGVQARCQTCGAMFRIASSDVERTCRCGGTVSAIGGGGGPLDGSRVCPACHAVNRGDKTFCVECQEPLGGATAPLLASHEEVEARRKATHRLRRAYKRVEPITWLFRLGVASYLVVAAVAVGALAHVEVPIGPGRIVVALATVLVVTTLLGTIHLPFRPLTWTIVAAVLASGVAVTHALGPNPLGLASLFAAAWAVGFWAAVFPARSMARLIDEHTDLYIEHHASRETKRSLRGRSARERHQRLVRAMRRASRRAWRISLAASVALVVASAAGAFLVERHLRPQVLEDALADFRTTWEASGPEGVVALAGDSFGEARQRRFVGLAASHGLADDPPPLERVELDRQPNDTWVFYRAGETELSARWRLLGTAWSLREMELPIPPFEPTLERFVAAWRASDAEAIAALYPPEHHTERGDALVAILDARAWESFPEIEDVVRSGDDVDEAIDVDLMTPGTRVETRWRLHVDGRWSLFEFELHPRRRPRARPDPASGDGTASEDG